MVTLYAPDFLDFQLGHRLLIGNDRQGFQHDIGKHSFFRLKRHFHQIIIILFLGTHLKCVLQFNNLNAPVFLPVLKHHIPYDFRCGLCIVSNGLSQCTYFHGLSHGKQQRFYDPFQFFQFHVLSFLLKGFYFYFVKNISLANVNNAHFHQFQNSQKGNNNLHLAGLPAE